MESEKIGILLDQLTQINREKRAALARDDLDEYRRLKYYMPLIECVLDGFLDVEFLKELKAICQSKGIIYY